MTLLDAGWTEEQVQGLLDRLVLVAGTPEWKAEHLERFRGWCAARQKDKSSIDAQLEFVAHDLCNGYEAVGEALKRAKTVQQAREAIEPYVRILREDRQWFQMLKPR